MHLDKRSRIQIRICWSPPRNRIRIRTKMSRIRNTELRAAWTSWRQATVWYRWICKYLEKKNVQYHHLYCHRYTLGYMSYCKVPWCCQKGQCLLNLHLISFLHDFSQFNDDIAFESYWLFSCECRV